MSSERELQMLLERALAHDKMAVSSLISIFEDQRAPAAPQRDALERELDARQRPFAAVLGLTGTPGCGKSSLLSRLVPELLAARADLRVAVLAVDPSSTISGGALLGDRTRMTSTAGEERLFFRSQASATDLGGLGPWTFSVCRLLARLFDVVLVETVGIGQSEADIQRLADRTYLVLGPLGGDEIQFWKAGIMEVPDVFVLNKCDEPSAERSYHQLRASLWLSRPFDAERAPIHRTSARTGLGIPELAAEMLAALGRGNLIDPRARDAFSFERWVRDEWGRVGLRQLESRLGGARAYLAHANGAERARIEFSKMLARALVHDGEPALTSPHDPHARAV